MSISISNGAVNYRDALNTTIERFGIRASELATNAGIEESRLSKYRNGHHMLRSDALQGVVDSLPVEARAYFYLLVMAHEGACSKVS